MQVVVDDSIGGSCSVGGDDLPICQLVHSLTSIPAALTVGNVDAVFEVARRSTTWTAPRRPSASPAE